MSLSQVLWLGSATVTSVIAAYYGMLAARLWLRSRSVLGPTLPETRKSLRRLLDVSRQGSRLTLTRLTLFYGGLGVFVVAVTAWEWPWTVLAVAPFVLIWWMDVRTTTPPVALILGTSTHSSIRRQRAINYRLSPLRVVSLLDVEVPWDSSLTNETVLDCFRTTNEDDWWLVITRLMEITPILLIDTGAETAGVLREGRHIFESDLWRKCLFLTPPDGSAPILDRLLPMSGVLRQELRIVRYDQAAHACATKVAQLRQQ